jgi:hypothetical protein
LTPGKAVLSDGEARSTLSRIVTVYPPVEPVFTNWLFCIPMDIPTSSVGVLLFPLKFGRTLLGIMAAVTKFFQQRRRGDTERHPTKGRPSCSCRAGASASILRGVFAV